ncbi:MAG: endonuclease/exonuclease/phosphatase family protein [Bdellovibrionales bacterium]|nr:endonuclease/exonuclease/phosphatase family protein [Bdellovibrionales bacterium]
MKKTRSFILSMLTGSALSLACFAGVSARGSVVCVASVSKRPPLHHRLLKYNLLPENPVSSSNIPQSHVRLKRKNNSLMVWNIQKITKGIKWTTDFLNLSHFADLFLLQEATEAIVPVAEHLGVHWTFGASWEQRGKHRTGVATLSRSQQKNGEFHVTDQVEKVFRTPKSSMITWHPIENSRKTLMAVNLHALNITGLKPFEEQIRHLANKVKYHDGPVIFAGDMNTWSAQRLHVALSILGEPSVGLQQVPMSSSRRLVLDHVFVRGLTNVSGYFLETIRSSDHLPIIVTYDIDPRYL